MRILAKCTLIGLISFLITSCGNDEVKDLSLNFKLQYDNQPLVLFQDLAYPNGETCQLKRVSFYLSDLRVSNNDGESSVVSEAEYIDLTNSHAELDDAIEGYTLNLGTTGLEKFDKLDFRIGLSDEQNLTVPEDYNSTSALSNSGEYWRAWGSYIYIKVEGYMDYNNNGLSDNGESFSLHCGTEIAKRDFSASVEDDGPVELVLDVKKVFENSQGIYDIKSGPVLHALSDENLANMTFLANGLVEGMSVE